MKDPQHQIEVFVLSYDNGGHGDCKEGKMPIEITQWMVTPLNEPGLPQAPCALRSPAILLSHRILPQGLFTDCPLQLESFSPESRTVHSLAA